MTAEIPTAASSPAARTEPPHAANERMAVSWTIRQTGICLPETAAWLIRQGAFGEDPTPHLLDRLAPEIQLNQRLLRWINSPLFNLDQELATLEQAAAMLGPQGLARLATLASVRALYHPDQQLHSYSRQQLWHHSVAVGAVASLLARISGSCSPHTALLAGMVHDIGLLAADRIAELDFAQLLGRLDPLTETWQAERELFGCDHQHLGAALLTAWGFPAPLIEVARHHHEPHQLEEGKGTGLVCCVAVADYLCTRCGWTALGVRNVPPPANHVFRRLGIDRHTLTVLWQRLYPTLEAVREIG